MKVSLVVDGKLIRNKFLHMRNLPRAGEVVESATYGTCNVLKVVHALSAKRPGPVLVLRRAR